MKILMVLMLGVTMMRSATAQTPLAISGSHPSGEQRWLLVIDVPASCAWTGTVINTTSAAASSTTASDLYIPPCNPFGSIEMLWFGSEADALKWLGNGIPENESVAGLYHIDKDVKLNAHKISVSIPHPDDVITKKKYEVKP
jgi:hypothetical protein